MRLWSIHPKDLDLRGLVALWREALLAQAVLRGQTRGYRNHPQLDRFRKAPAPLDAIALYLEGVFAEAVARGYSFDRGRIGPARQPVELVVTRGQMDHEWARFLAKLRGRQPELHGQWKGVQTPDPHPLFQVREGAIEPWERNPVNAVLTDHGRNAR